MKAKISKIKTHKKKGEQNKEPVFKECSIKQLSYLDALLQTCTLSLKEHEQLRFESYCNLTEGRAEEMINYLLENQRDSIDGGFRYSNEDIEMKLYKLMNH